MPLTGFAPLSVDIGLSWVRNLGPELTAIRGSLAGEHPKATLYLPFQFRSDGLRLMSNYFAKLPAQMQGVLFGNDGMGESGLPDPPEEDGLAASADDHARPGGFLRPFKPKADKEYITNVSGGPTKHGLTHEALVNDFAGWLASRGLLAACHMAIDLGLEVPAVIIEAKVIHSGRWARAIREAVGQLYEYRYFQVVSPDSALIFLASTLIPQRWLDYLELDREIGAAWRSKDGFQLSTRASKALGI